MAKINWIELKREYIANKNKILKELKRKDLPDMVRWNYEGLLKFYNMVLRKLEEEDKLKQRRYV